MPNVRAKEKVFVGCFVTTSLKANLTGLASTRGITITDFIQKALEDACQEAQVRSTDQNPRKGSVSARAPRSGNQETQTMQITTDSEVNRKSPSPEAEHRNSEDPHAQLEAKKTEAWRKFTDPRLAPSERAMAYERIMRLWFEQDARAPGFFEYACHLLSSMRKRVGDGPADDIGRDVFERLVMRYPQPRGCPRIWPGSREWNSHPLAKRLERQR